MKELILKIRQNNHVEEVKVSKSRFTLGSSQDNDYIVKGSSPRHVVIYFSNGNWYMNANSEVILNDRKFQGEVELKQGDRIEIDGTIVDINFKEEETAYLRVLSGPDAGKIIEVKETGTLGRAPNNLYVINDPYVSRTHARIVKEDSIYVLEDLNPKNPILVNGKLLKRKQILKSGDELQIGKTRLLFVDPSVMPESLLFRKPSRKPLWIMLGILALAIISAGMYAFASYRTSKFYEHLSASKNYLMQVSEAQKVEEKIKLINLAEYELEQAQKFGRNYESENIASIVSSMKQAWKKVHEAKELIAQGKLKQAQQLMAEVEPVLYEDELFREMYNKLQRATVVKEVVSMAYKLKQEGREEEAQKLLAIAVEKAKPVEESQKEKKLDIEESKLGDTDIDLTPKKEEGGISFDVPEIKIDVGDVNINITPEDKELGGSISIGGILKLKELYEKGDLDGTIKMANDMLKSDPNNSTAKYYLKLARKEKKALSLERQGRKKEAMRIWADILQLDPNNKRAKKALIRLGSG